MLVRNCTKYPTYQTSRIYNIILTQNLTVRFVFLSNFITVNQQMQNDKGPHPPSRPRQSGTLGVGGNPLSLSLSLSLSLWETGLCMPVNIVVVVS